MITLKNISAVFVVPLLSMIFLASSARANVAWSDKDKSKALAHHEQPKQHQQAARFENHQKRSDQAMHRDQWVHRDHDKNIQQVRRNYYFIDHPFYRPVRVFSYVNIIPVGYNVGYNADYNAGTPSIGDFVDRLPAGYLAVIINKVTYAVYQDVFYKQVFSEYQVVDPFTLVFNRSFSIGILNSGGTYTQIQMNTVVNGFIGPQGEFYSQFPSIQQLQAMYAR